MVLSSIHEQGYIIERLIGIPIFMNILVLTMYLSDTMDMLFLGLPMGIFLGVGMGVYLRLHCINLRDSYQDTLLSTILFGLVLPYLLIWMDEYMKFEAISFSISYIACFYIIFFGLYSYPWYVVSTLFRSRLTANPYLNDGVIRLPIWGLTARLTQQARHDPGTGLQFMEFLLEYRPLQRSLAMHIAHAATSGQWQQHLFQSQYFTAPPSIQKVPRLTPSATWLNSLENTAENLKNWEQAFANQENISLQKQIFESFVEQLQTFRNVTLLESARWNHYYLPALNDWLKHAQQRLAQLTEDAKNLEPITANIYRFGEKLQPGLDRDIFLGRRDVCAQLRQEILTARTLPMFLFYGQRRVGKSSLLKFLPTLLSGNFRLIEQDCQDARIQENDVLSWLTDLRIAFDEYESLHERIFCKQPESSKYLLEAMRSFSQQQNQVVFLFVGATQFIDLTQPDWNRCFIHAMPLKIDFLKREEAMQLITKPVNLRYPETVLDEMWRLTQGHPALLQMICRFMVDIANREERKDMTLEDLNWVVDEKVVQRDTNALSTFWTEFCRNFGCQDTIAQILAQQPITEPANFIKLKEYGYLISDNHGGWKLRVPLLEMWLQAYRHSVNSKIL
jgi:hypothetical protein